MHKICLITMWGSMWRVICHYAWFGKGVSKDKIQFTFGRKSTYFENYENLFGKITKTF
jgi:hypothetical protein